MKSENLLALALGVGIVAYFISRKSTVIASASLSPAQQAGFQFNPVPGVGTNSSAVVAGFQSDGAALGQALTDMTGIGGFADAGATIGQIFGAGQSAKDQRQATENDLVQKYQNPLEQQAANLIAQWHVALNSGRATMQVKETLKRLLTNLVNQFDSIAMSYGRVGQNGINTVNGVLNTVWLPNIELDYAKQGVP
jgi:hypothetical protein